MKDKVHISDCPVCQEKEFSHFLDPKDWLISHEMFSIYRCDHCGFMFTQDAPAPHLAETYYEHVDYVEHSDSNKGLIFTLYHQARKLMLGMKLGMLKKTHQGKRLLDIGSGSGYFLHYMKSHGYDCEGVEISENARKLCKDKFGITAHEPDVLINNTLDKTFDLITLWHVFEHVYSYDDYFEAFKKILSPGGRLVIAMPNFHCLEAAFYREYWNGYDVPRHLWHFDIDTFTRFAKDRGFSLKKVRILPLDPFYNALVSADYRKSFSGIPLAFGIGLLSYLQGLVSKRKASSLVYILEKTN